MPRSASESGNTTFLKYFRYWVGVFYNLRHPFMRDQDDLSGLWSHLEFSPREVSAGPVRQRQVVSRLDGERVVYIICNSTTPDTHLFMIR